MPIFAIRYRTKQKHYGKFIYSDHTRILLSTKTLLHICLSRSFRFLTISKQCTLDNRTSLFDVNVCIGSSLQTEISKVSACEIGKKSILYKSFLKKCQILIQTPLLRTSALFYLLIKYVFFFLIYFRF